MKRNIKIERIYFYTIEQVWEALADNAALNDWLMKTDFQPYVGHHFNFHAPPSPGFDGLIQCEVILVNKPHQLAYTWKGGPMKRPTTVRWTLESIPQGTRLTLEHTGFEGFAGLAISFILDNGWRGLVSKSIPEYIEKHLIKVQLVQ